MTPWPPAGLERAGPTSCTRLGWQAGRHREWCVRALSNPILSRPRMSMAEFAGAGARRIRCGPWGHSVSDAMVRAAEAIRDRGDFRPWMCRGFKSGSRPNRPAGASITMEPTGSCGESHRARGHSYDAAARRICGGDGLVLLGFWLLLVTVSVAELVAGMVAAAIAATAAEVVQAQGLVRFDPDPRWFREWESRR